MEVELSIVYLLSVLNLNKIIYSRVGSVATLFVQFHICESLINIFNYITCQK
jgi:hypothetical protein